MRMMYWHTEGALNCFIFLLNILAIFSDKITQKRFFKSSSSLFNLCYLLELDKLGYVSEKLK